MRGTRAGLGGRGGAGAGVVPGSDPAHPLHAGGKVMSPDIDGPRLEHEQLEHSSTQAAAGRSGCAAGVDRDNMNIIDANRSRVCSEKTSRSSSTTSAFS